MSRRPVTNPLALAVLACLWERPMYPYEITTTLRERGKDSSIRLNFGSLYAVIKSLEKHGFISESRAEREGNRPERTVYEITDAGRTETHEWLSELLSTPQREYPSLEAGLSLVAILSPEEAERLLRERVERLDAELAESTRTLTEVAQAGLSEIFLVEGNFHDAMLRAERDWLAVLIERLAAGTVGGQQLWVSMHDMLASGRSPAEVQAALEDAVGGPQALRDLTVQAPT
jgi:DNA-binding PadR family transcriptional regulator